MTIAIHQPNYLPYLGFFDKMLKADHFIILDDAQFSKGDFHNRNRINTIAGPKWLTIPVKGTFMPIKDVVINKKNMFSGMKWFEYHLKLINDNYFKTKFFKVLFYQLEEIYKKEFEKLLEINLALIFLLKKLFEIKTPVSLSSELGIKSSATQRLIDICNYFSAKTYLSGKAGPNYMDLNLFEKNNISVLIQNFSHPVYEQGFNHFEKNLSSIDAFFNAGNILEL
jgi:WbqC-like protein family